MWNPSDMTPKERAEFERIVRLGDEAEAARRAAMLTPGDRVLCLDATDHAHFLVVGRTYTVDSVRESDGWVSVAGMCKMWEPERFRLAREAAGLIHEERR